MYLFLSKYANNLTNTLLLSLTTKWYLVKYEKYDTLSLYNKIFKFFQLKNYLGKRDLFRFVFNGQIKTRMDWHLSRFSDDFVFTSEPFFEGYLIFANMKPILKSTKRTLTPNNLTPTHLSIGFHNYNISLLYYWHIL